MVSRALDVFTKIILSTEEEDARMTMPMTDRDTFGGLPRPH